MVDGLAFLPIVDLPVAMSYLHRNTPDVDRVAELVTYFDNTYVSGTVRRPNTDADDGRLLLRLTRSPPLFPAGLERSRVNRQRDGPNEQRQRGVEPCVRVHGWPQPSLCLEDPGRPPAEHDDRVRRLCLARQEGRKSVVETLRAVGHGIRLDN